jgi:hypothetical protein
MYVPGNWGLLKIPIELKDSRILVPEHWVRQEDFLHRKCGGESAKFLDAFCTAHSAYGPFGRLLPAAEIDFDRTWYYDQRH